jgi:hypothetical protein
MRALVLIGKVGAWGLARPVGPRSGAELKEAAAHFDPAAALSTAPAVKAEYASLADHCRGLAAGP